MALAELIKSYAEYLIGKGRREVSIISWGALRSSPGIHMQKRMICLSASFDCGVSSGNSLEGEKNIEKEKKKGV